MRLDMDSSRRFLWPTAQWLGVLLLVALMSVAAPAHVVAEEQEHEESSGEHQEDEKELGEEHGEEHEFHKHHIAVILSATEAVEEHGEGGHGETHSESSNGGKDDPDFTIGFDYERRLTRLFGFGGMIDWVVEGRREFLFGPIGFLHPFAGSKFWLAPLAERVRETGDWELVWRIGAGWDIPIGKSGKYSIAPNVNYDITEEHELWVVGVAIGRGW